MSVLADPGRRRAVAAARYQPQQIELLLVAEAPPSAPDRYFYFDDVRGHDSLFRHVVRAVLGTEPSRAEKAADLQRLSHRGVFLVDLKPDPKLPGQTLDAYVPDLVSRAAALKPRHIIAIKVSVFDLVSQPLRAAGLNVGNQRVPFPASGQQRRFLAQMTAALDSIGWHR
jgi:hypothetical protein